MAIEMREGSITFSRATGRKQGGTDNVVFPRPIRRAPRGRIGTVIQVMLKGYNIHYDNGDHHILEQEINLSAILGPLPTIVRISCDFGLRDSGGFDDPYSGWVKFVVIADVP